MLVSFRLGLGLDLYDDTGLPLSRNFTQLVAGQERDLAKVCLSVIVNGGVSGELHRNLGVEKNCGGKGGGGQT